MENIKELDTKEAQKIAEELEDNYNTLILENLIKESQKIWKLDENKYRIRLLTRTEEELIYEELSAYYDKLYFQKDKEGNKVNHLKIEWIKEHKERGVDIDEMEKTIKHWKKEIESEEKRLGLDLTRKISHDVLKSRRDKINELQLKVRLMEIEIENLLQYSIESKLQQYESKLVTFYSLEKEEDNKWIRACKDVEDLNIINDKKIFNEMVSTALILRYAK